MSNRQTRNIFGMLITALGALSVTAVVPSNTSAEIAHLLSFIEKSGCTFIRNDTRYDSLQAREHIENKYRHTKAFTDNTEDFIAYTATKSSISGTLYRVSCREKEQPSAKWLLDELEIFRNHLRSGRKQ